MATVQLKEKEADRAPGASPSYSLSYLVISSILPTHYHESRSLLYWLEAMLHIYAAYKKIYPSTYKNELGSLDLGKKSLAEIWDQIRYAEKKKQEHPLGSEVLGLLNQLFPVDEDVVYQDMVEGEGDGFPSIWIFPQYFYFSGDDIDEMLEHPEDLDPGLGVILFFIVWDHQLGEETWNICKAHYGWPVDYLDTMDRDSYLDDETLSSLLKENGLYPFYDLYLSAVYATGNPFIDFDEYGNDRQWELTFKNILYLKEQWDAAQPIMENCRIAEEMYNKDPQVLVKVMDLIRQSIKTKEKKKG